MSDAEANYYFFLRVICDGQPPIDVNARLDCFSRRASELLIDRLVPLLRDLEVESQHLRKYPFLVPVPVGQWFVLLRLEIMLSHAVPPRELIRRVNEEAIAPLARLAMLTLNPLPPAESWPTGIHPKQAFGFLPLQFWAATAR